MTDRVRFLRWMTMES